MVRKIDAMEIVWLSVIAGQIRSRSREEAEREIGRDYSQNYVNSLRSWANRLIRARYHELEGSAMSARRNAGLIQPRSWRTEWQRNRVIFAALVSCLCVIVQPSLTSANEHRSRTGVREFQREPPCPSTGQTSGACPGYWEDHVVPLACGGPDAVSNLQWQTIRDARAKDAWERRACSR